MYRFVFQRETADGTEEIEFPLAPSQFKTKVGNKNKTIELVSVGEVNIIKNIGLRDFSFKLLLPKDDTLITEHKNYVDDNGDIIYKSEYFKMVYHEPIWYLNRLRELKADSKPFFLVIIRQALKENEVETYIPVNISSYRVNEELFSYNKDSDQWFCLAGNETYNKKSSIVKKHGKDYKVLRYYFNKEKCRNCPYRQKCLGSTKSVGKVFQISTNTPEYYEYSQRAKQPEFLEKYKKRAYIERKNGEMKRFHGLARARGYGLRSVLFQTIFTAIAVNLKRIAKLISSLDTTNIALIYNLQLVVLKFQSTWIFGLGFTLKSA